MTFEELQLNDDILDALWDMRFDECTPIQEKAIPVILEGRDIIGTAQTGTGKTASFLLPVLHRIASGQYPVDRINCLIMSPTRELAQQIDQQLQGFSYYMDVTSVAVYGGNDGPEFSRQKKGLKMGADIVIATPGRLISHLNVGNVDLSEVSFLVLDEADRMLDMGFLDDILKIVSYLPDTRQTIMFSATMPPKIKKLAASILSEPVNVQIAVSRPGEQIRQEACVCYENQKIPVLKQYFKEVNPERTLIFASSKLKVKELTREFRSMGFNVGEMHSDLDQNQREDVILGFRSGRIPLMVATDIVARGIDIDDIQLVVNFDVPRESEDYIHRIGRTARAGASGRSLTFVNDKDMDKFRRIEKFLGTDVAKIDVPADLGQTPDYSRKNNFRGDAGKTGKKRNSSKNRMARSKRNYRRKDSGQTKNPQNKRINNKVKTKNEDKDR